MKSNETNPVASEKSETLNTDRKIGRRTAIKAGVATAAGVALGTTYVKPGMISVFVQEAQALYREEGSSSAETLTRPAKKPSSGDPYAAVESPKTGVNQPPSTKPGTQTGSTTSGSPATTGGSAKPNPYAPIEPVPSSGSQAGKPAGSKPAETKQEQTKSATQPKQEQSKSSAKSDSVKK